MTKQNFQTVSITLSSLLLLGIVNSFGIHYLSGFLSGIIITFLAFHYIGRFLLKKVLEQHDIENKY